MKKYIFLFLFGLFILFCALKYIPFSLPALPQSQIIFDSHQKELGEIVFENNIRHQEEKNYPNFLKQVILEIEDRRFYYHFGIDPLALFRAIKNNFQGHPTQGASTIENQLIRNSFWLNEKRTYHKKIREYLYTFLLTTHYSKEEILNQYLNRVHLGKLNYGYASAAKYYFGKPISMLTQGEMIALVTISKNPNVYHPFVSKEKYFQRFHNILNTLADRGVINSQEKNRIEEEKIIFQKNASPTELPYVVDFIKKYSSPSTGNISTNIDISLTKNVENLAKQTLNSLAWKSVGDYGVIVVERSTMKLRVMIGGNNYYGENGQVNATLALRQPGSTLKPFIYLQAFEKLKKTPSSSILDLPISYPTNDGNRYEPKNYSLKYLGEITLAQALSQSINIPAVKLLEEIGEEKFLYFLRSLGLSTLDKSSDFYGLSLALGSGEVRLFDLVQAYSIFAHDGKFCTIRVEQNQELFCKNIVEKKYTQMVYDILSNRYFKLGGFPLYGNLDFGEKDVFIKTGTSRNFKDNWAVGFTPKYLIGVWVGNKSGEEMKGVSGADGAGDIFKKIVDELDYSTQKSGEFLYQNQTLQSTPYLEIITPLKESVYQDDPYKSEDVQKVHFQFSTNIPYSSYQFILNGKPIYESFEYIKNLSSQNTLTLKIFQGDKIIKETSSIFYKQ